MRKLTLLFMITAATILWFRPRADAGVFEVTEQKVCLEFSISGNDTWYTYQICRNGLSYCTPTYAPCMHSIPVVVYP